MYLWTLAAYTFLHSYFLLTILQCIETLQQHLVKVVSIVTVGEGVYRKWNDLVW